MDWGILSGLGQGLQTIGNSLFTTELSKKLEQDRLDREQSKFDPTQTKYKQIDTDGGPLWYEVKYNKAGDVIDQQLAPKNVIDEMEASSKERGLKARLLDAQVSNTEYSGNRTKIKDSREDEEYTLLSPEDRRQAARYKAGLDITPAQQLQANTSLQTAVTRGAGRGSAKSKDEDVDYQDIASDLKKQDPATYLDVGKLMGTTSDSATTAVIASLIQELTSQFPDRKLSPQDIMAAARAYRARWKSGKAENDSTTSVSTRLQP